MVLPAVRRMEPVAPFQVAGDAVAATEEIVLIQPPAALVHVDGNDVQVVATDVLVLVNHVGLVTITELFHILACEVFELDICQAVVRVRVQGDMDDRVAGTHIGGHAAFEVFRRPGRVHLSGTRIENLVGGKEPALLPVHLFAVIGECPVKGAAYTDFCDHRSSNLRVSSIILRLSEASSRVCFSSL